MASPRMTAMSTRPVHLRASARSAPKVLPASSITVLPYEDCYTADCGAKGSKIAVVRKYWENPVNAAGEGSRATTPVPASVSIGGVEIAPATVLAPMAGVTDIVF